VFVLVALASVCTTSFGFPRLHGDLGRTVWLAGVAQAATSLLGAWAVGKVRAAGGDAPLVEVVGAAWGGGAARAYLLAVAAYLLLWPPIAVFPVTVTTVESSLIPLAPSWQVALPLIAAAAYAAWFGPEVVGRLAELALWVIAPVVLIAAIVPWSIVDPRLLWPPVAAAPVRIGPEFAAYAFSLRGFVAALVLPVSAPRPGDLTRPAVLATVSAWLVVNLLFVLPHGIFPALSLPHITNPVLYAVDSIPTRSLAIHSLLAAITPVWFGIAVFSTAVATWSAAELLRQASGAPRARWPLALAVGIDLASLWPDLWHRLPLLAGSWSLYGLVVAVLAPWLLVAGARRRAPALAPA